MCHETICQHVLISTFSQGRAMMDGNTIATWMAVIGGPTTIGILYRWAKAQGRAEALQEQSAATIKAKDLEIAELNTENTRLWDLLTRPQGTEK